MTRPFLFFSKPLVHHWKSWFDLAPLPIQFIDSSWPPGINIGCSPTSSSEITNGTKCLHAALHPGCTTPFAASDMPEAILDSYEAIKDWTRGIMQIFWKYLIASIKK